MNAGANGKNAGYMPFLIFLILILLLLGSTGY